MCQHQIALCKLHGCKNCDHHHDEEHCPYVLAVGGETTPTFAEMISVFVRFGRACRARKMNTVNTVAADLKLLGIDTNAKCTEMTRTRFKTLIQMLQSPLREGGALRDHTIKSHLQAFSSLTNEAFEDGYAMLDPPRDLPAFSIPTFKVGKVEKQSLTDDQVRQIQILMEGWLASGKDSGRNKFLYCFFYLNYGTRPSDIFRFTWDVIKQTPMGVMLVYTPHKTEKSSGVRVSRPMSPREYAMIKPLIGKPNELVIPILENRTPGGSLKDGEYVGKHTYLVRQVGKALKEIGIGGQYRGQKVAYAMRKRSMTDDAIRHGDAVAAKWHGDSVDTAKKFYISDSYSTMA